MTTGGSVRELLAAAERTVTGGAGPVVALGMLLHSSVVHVRATASAEPGRERVILEPVLAAGYALVCAVVLDRAAAQLLDRPRDVPPSAAADPEGAARTIAAALTARHLAYAAADAIDEGRGDHMILATAAKLAAVEGTRRCANDLVPEWTLYRRGVRLDLGRSLRDLVRLRAAGGDPGIQRRRLLHLTRQDRARTPVQQG